MWPEPGEALTRTLDFEDALADMYAAALNTWVIDARKSVLSLTAASVPPSPDAVEENSQVWDDIAVAVILAGMSSLWSLALVEALTGMGLPIPDVFAEVDEIPASVTRAITRNTHDIDTEDIHTARAVVEGDPWLRDRRDEFVAAAREHVSATPALVNEKLWAAVREATPADTDPSLSIEVVITHQRNAAAAVLTPGSPEVIETARYQGYQAAGVQNAAVLAAAATSEDAGELDKIWIATIDGKTRPTHFAADGQRAPLAGKFSVGTAELDCPGDLAGPPAEVKNCRCRVGILAHDEELPDEVDRHTERLNGRDSVQVNRKGSQRDEIERRERQGTIRARDDEDGIGRTASLAPTKENPMKFKTPKPGPTLVADAGEDEGETFRTFTDQPIAFIGIETSDGRMLQDGIDLSVRTPPLPMMWTKQTGYGHEDAFTVGVIESAKADGDKVLGSGYWLNTAEADEAFNEATHKVSRPSVDLAATEWILTDGDGKEITEDDWYDLPADTRIIQTITAAELIGTTMVATPAFGDTMIEFNPERESRDLAMVASAAESWRPRVYDAALFSNPNLAEPTPMTMDPDTGRIFGHLACFGQCHRSIQAECVIAPRSRTDYSQFLTSPPVALNNGTRVPVGRLTVGSGHADDKLSGPQARAHYDNVGTCFAIVTVGEDAHGVWFSGVAAPWATPEQIEMGFSAPLSGDWRDFGQGLDLVAALAVNTPGFAVRGREDAYGRPAVLVASLAPAPFTGKRRNDTQLTAEAIGAIVETAVARAVENAAAQADIDALLAQAEADGVPKPLTPDEEIDALLAEADL